MSSSVQGKKDSHLRIISSEDAVVFPENATPTDDAPTVISRTPPSLDSSGRGKSKNQLTELARQSMSPEALVASLRGRRLAHFELIEPIGVGGMAAVIRARDTQLDRFVALKILPPEMALEIENVQRFHQEAKAAAKLDHENIARVFFCGEDQGLHFIAFEFVEGINLRTLMERRGVLPVAESIRYVLQIAAGLEHAANRGVVHRDVKPSNIIISPNGRAKLVDMGLARNLDRHGERDLTQSGVTLGTFDYISPEQALEPREADSRSDVYSLGCTLYHMLTGRPAVPDGTPAKKLNHHQHIAPIDPRLINPKVPVELVMVLSKMMAKNPKDRYQKPIHLVQDLAQVAQTVGAADEVADGVLSLETTAPRAPTSRPLLVIGLALVSLVAVVLILSLAPDPRPTVPAVPITDSTKNKSTRPPTTDQAKGKERKSPPSIAPTVPSVVKDVEGLRAVLAAGTGKEVKASIEGRIDLGSTTLTYQSGSDRRLVIDSNDDNAHAVIHFRYVPGGAVAGLVIDGGEEVVFRRIRFQIDSSTTPQLTVAAIAVRGAKRVLFDRCIFSQADVQPISPGRLPLASVLIEGPEGNLGERPEVVVNNSEFLGSNKFGGQVAIAVDGPLALHANSCGFKPHGAFVHIRGRSTAATTAIHWKHCAGFVANGPAFRFDDKTSAHLHVDSCVFSNVDGSLAPKGLPEPNLIYHKDQTPVLFTGRKNLYHNLNYLVGNINRELDFQKYLAANSGSDISSLHLSTPSPWQATQPLDDKLGVLAFQLKSEYHGSFGLVNTWTGVMPAPPAAVAKIPMGMPKIKIVDPDDFGTPGVYANLVSALGVAQDGDLILLKHSEASRYLKVPQIALPPGAFVTIKPFDEYQPILIMDKEYSDRDSSLFKLQSGGLHFDGVEFLLDPGTKDFSSRSVVQLGESASCSFKRCKITLRTVGDVKLHVVSFLDSNMMAKMETPVPPTRIEFSECFVRGKGDLLNMRGSQPLEVDVRKSILVLAGQLLDITTTGKNGGPDRVVHWRMEHSSVFTSESIFTFGTETGSMKGLPKTLAEATSCLFAALGPDQRFVPDMNRDEPLKSYLDWKGLQNGYVGFTRLADWKDIYFEEKSSIYQADRLAFLMLNEASIKMPWDLSPELLRPTEIEAKTLMGFGVPAEIEQRWVPPPTKTDDP